MALDAGTGSCRAVIFDRSGNQISFSQEEWTHKPLKGYPMSQVFDTKTNWKLISLCIRNAIEKAGISGSQIRGISATSMREGMVLYDENGIEIWACPNVDSRAQKESTELVRSEEAKKIYFTAGDWVSITSPARFLWIKKHEPTVFKKIAHMSMLADWILYRLSGELVTDPSLGSSSGLFDLEKRTWSSDLIKLIGLEERIFPRVVSSGTVIGSITKEAAAETLLPEGTPVVVGGADTQLGLCGIGISKAREITILGGSFWQYTILLNTPLIDPKIRLRTLCGTIEGQWMLEGIGFYCGLSMRWFRDAFCDKEKEEALRMGIDAYQIMEREAEQVPPGSNGVVGIFSNIMNSKRWIHASPALLEFDVTNPQNSGKKESIRAIEEAAGYVSLGHHKIIKSLTRSNPDRITFAGGGSKGTLWPQIISDILGVRVEVPVIKESTALGAAICAGVGAGFFQNIQEGSTSLAKIERSFSPRKRIHQEYLLLYEKWLKIYQRNLQISEQGLLSPMWRAAGA